MPLAASESFARFASIAGVVLVAFGATPAAMGAGRSVVLLQIPPEAGGWPAAERRVAAELASVGFEVSVASLPEIPATPGRPPAWDPSAEDMAKWTSERNSIAVVRITRSGAAGTATTTVDVVDRITGKTTTRRVRAAGVGPPPDANSAALMAVELLYASLLEIEAPHAQRGEVTATPEVRAMVRQQLLTPAEPGRLAVSLGTSVSLPAGGLSAGPGLLLGGGTFVFPWLCVGTDVRVNAFPAKVGSDSMNARVGWATGRLQVAAYARSARTISFFLGAGAGWLSAWSSGESGSGIPARTDTAGTSFVVASGGIAIRVRSLL
ncbi:MAG: hypothetical protein ABUS79_14245, partial [Pseudomonadota bacterium]